MKNVSIKEISSIATTTLTAIGAGYAGLANIWGFPYADKAVASIAVVVSLISAVLGAFTMKKISDRTAANNKSEENDDTALVDTEPELTEVPASVEVQTESTEVK